MEQTETTQPNPQAEPARNPNMPKEWAKLLFFKLGENFLMKALVRVGLSMTGPVGWVVSLVIDKVLKSGWQYGYGAWMTYVWAPIKAKRDAKKVKDVINKPGATPEEIANASDDFMRS